MVSDFRDLHWRNSLRIVESRTLWWDTSSVGGGPWGVSIPLIGTPYVGVVTGQGTITEPDVSLVVGICDSGVPRCVTKRMKCRFAGL